MREARAYRGLQDGQLVALVAEDDPGALETLYDRYGRAAYSLALRVLNDEHLAIDVVRQVFLSLWRDTGGLDAAYDPSGPIGGQMLAATHHRAVEVVRREENLRRRGGPREAARLDSGPAEATAGDGEEAERRGLVRAALATLPRAQREALLLAYFGGYTQREVASLLGVPLETVKSRMAAAVRRLRDSLREANSAAQRPWTLR